MNKQASSSNKQLKNYTDQELMEEITHRIKNHSLEMENLLLPLATISYQYLAWYQEQKTKKDE